MITDELSGAVVRLVNQVGHWTPARWAAPASAASASAAPTAVEPTAAAPAIATTSVTAAGPATTPASAAGPAAPGGGLRDGGSRADLMHGLVQRLADLAADAEGIPHRTVPRLDSDLALPDQLRVITADLLAAGPPPDVTAAAVAAVNAARHALTPDGAAATNGAART